jgi:uncharacterized protein YecE (DUF72 family)
MRTSVLRRRRRRNNRERAGTKAVRSFMGEARIGISGWRYAPWRGVFYPRGLAQHRELEFASREFRTIEINGSFYSLQTPESYAAWHADTPEGFVFAIKGSRYITHILRLRDCRQALSNFYASGIFNLREKIGPFLWQLPPTFKYDADRLARFFELLPRDTDQAARLARRRDARLKGRARIAIDVHRPLQHAIEVRHASFIDESFVALLRRHRIALVVADTAGKWPFFEDVTADFMYLRLHGDQELYASGYTPAALDRWEERIRKWCGNGDVYCYFDNDKKVHAPFDAHALEARLNGTPITRVRGRRRSRAADVIADARRFARNKKRAALSGPRAW